MGIHEKEISALSAFWTEETRNRAPVLELPAVSHAVWAGQATLTRPPLVVTSPSIAPDPGFYGPSRPRKTSRSEPAAAKSPFFLAGSRRKVI